MSTTSSNSPWILSGMKANNAPLEAPVKAFLHEIVRAPQTHAKFMNMLSMLEHMGSRKIMLSQMNRTLTEDILKHLAEEARHAYFFKRQAERAAKKSLDGYTDQNTFCRVPALMYFGRLDAGLTKMLQVIAPPLTPPQAGGKRDLPAEALAKAGAQGGSGEDNNHPYPWVSLIIELRACWLYAIYQEVLEEEKISISLKSLLAEEDLHLAEMFALCGDNAPRLQALSTYETDLFGKLFTALQEQLSLNLRKAA
jgi:hypothetical protein